VGESQHFPVLLIYAAIALEYVRKEIWGTPRTDEGNF